MGSVLAGELDVVAAGFAEPAPQPGSNGSTNHAIDRITAEQMRAARD